MIPKLEAWLKSGEYLPDALRDFHDQKDVFKCMHERIDISKDPMNPAKNINWIAGQCYVIDTFLWFMARRGYTLQRSRKQGIEFRSLIDDVDHSNKAREQQFSNIISGAVKQ